MSQTATVGQLVVERPSRARVFERYGIDYCCGGKIPLDQACSAKKVDLQQVLRDLLAEEERPAGTERNWAGATLGELADHIETTHHAYLREELPRLEYLIGRVVRAHGERRPELIRVQTIFAGLKEELESHMGKEEQILFPLCRAMESATGPTSFHCGSVQNPIRVMLAEHDDAGAALEQMRQLTGDYLPPADACNTYRAMLAGLAELEANMHQHVHKENNILFPKAVALEARLAESR